MIHILESAMIAHYPGVMASIKGGDKDVKVQHVVASEKNEDTVFIVGIDEDACDVFGRRHRGENAPGRYAR